MGGMMKEPARLTMMLRRAGSRFVFALTGVQLRSD
jgi:hypothetical protein